MPLLGSVGGVLWSSRAKAGLVDANRKSRALLSSTGSAKGRSRGRPCEAGRVFITGLSGSHIMDLGLLQLSGCPQRACACVRGLGSV